ncbi:DUF1963 domain-containing protein [Chitinophaga agrisoli]|uniref:DUF1963 domain-containing protein n=1 Tax=Chitinophaga agrisoli TaxID=2607653 RepID=A0A5B2VVT2_9BACT|nr:DUF1963 domain-containing protein [Chitinophaga agrisoli]KAA2243391.1 DUF1963 domain-containing protein [Chitinophaga agrisoli]
MQESSTKTFSVRFPDIYQRIQAMWETIRGEHTQEDGSSSLAAIGLNEVSFYDKFPGADLPSRFRQGCMEQRGDVELIADKTLPLAGLASYIRTVKSDEFYFYFGLVQINNEYCYTITGDCGVKDQAFYEPLFDEIWQSLQYFGDPGEEFAKQQAAIDAMFAKYAPATKEAEEKKTASPFHIPADGQDSWELGGHQFRLLPDSKVHISETDGALYVRLDGEMPGYSDDAHGHLLNDYEDGKVYLQFYFKGIYNNGTPTGTFIFEQERDETYRSYLWKGGFPFSFNFNGTATLQDGWLGISGHFDNYLLQVAKRLPVEELEWTKYRFLSAEELETATPDIVHHIQLTNPDPALLNDTLHPFTEMETLTVFYSSDNEAATSLLEVPTAIKGFMSLRELNLTGIRGIDSLPQWIGDLKELERLDIAGSQIADIHPSIFQLPKLQYCYLSNNRLQSIPPVLPDTLKTLVLENNQLTSLPASLSALPQLRHLNISRNPLQELPPGLEKIADLNLELEKKMSLLDYTYHGANGKGVIPYDGTMFQAINDTGLRQTLENAVKALQLGDYQQGLLQLARQSVALATTAPDDYANTGNHRFGGLPDLPPDIAYPSFTDQNGHEKGLQFIAQLNCADISHLQDYLPRTGMLYFFIQDQEEMGPKVIYFDGDLTTLQSAAGLDIEEDYIFDQNGIYTPFQAAADKYPGIPFFYNARDYFQDKAPELEALEEMYDETKALKEALYPSVNPVHSVNSYVFKQHDTPEAEAVNALKGKPEDWMVLLRVSSDDNTGFNFWDAGDIYFMIHKSDLVQGDFSNVYCGLESS